MATRQEELVIKLRADLDQYDRETRRVFKNSVEGANKTSNAFGRTEKSAENLNKVGSKALRAFAGVVVTALSAKKIQEYADMFTIVQNKIKTVISPTEDLGEVTGRLLSISNETRTSLDATATLYSRLRRNTEELGLSQEDLFEITETVNKSFAISGATTAETSASIRQLSQAFASGVLRGDEFNSIAEQAPIIMEAISKSTGIAKGELRELAAEGKLSAQVVAESLQAYADVINADFLGTTITAAQAQEVLSNNFTLFVGAMDEAFGITESTVGVYQALSTSLVDMQQPLIDSALFMKAFFEVTKDSMETSGDDIEDLVDTYDMQLNFAKDLFGAFALVVTETLLFLPDMVKKQVTSAIGGFNALIDGSRKTILEIRKAYEEFFGDESTVAIIDAQLAAIGDTSFDIWIETLENQRDATFKFFDEFGQKSAEMNQAIADKKLEILAETDAIELERLKEQLALKQEAIDEFEREKAGTVKLDNTKADEKALKKKETAEEKARKKSIRDEAKRVRELTGLARKFAASDKDIATQAFQFTKDKAASSILAYAAEGAEKVISQLGYPGIPIAGVILAGGAALANEVSGLGIGGGGISSTTPNPSPNLTTTDLPQDVLDIDTSITTESGTSDTVIRFESSGNQTLDAIFEFFSEGLRTGKIRNS